MLRIKGASYFIDIPGEIVHVVMQTVHLREATTNMTFCQSMPIATLEKTSPPP
jgi:hypothetical protein